MNKIKYCALIALLLTIAGCDDSASSAYSDPDYNKEYPAQLVLVQDNIKLYRVWTREPEARNHWTYFTVPCGDVSNIVEFQSGKTMQQINTQVNGTCSPFSKAHKAHT